MRLTRHRVERRDLIGIGLLGLGNAVGFLLVYYLTVRTLQGRLFADASLRGALLTRSTFITGTDAVLDVVSTASLLAAVALVATIALVRLARVRGLAGIGVLAGANVSTQVLKRYLLDRPDLGLVEVSPATLNSLPSGHTTAVFSAVAALLVVVPARWRYPVALLGLAASTATALATMTAGWHRAGDSIAALLLVGVWTALAAATVLIFGASSTREPAYRWPPSTRWLGVVGIAVLALGVTLGTGLNLAAPIRDQAVGSWFAFVISGLVILGAGIAVVLGMLAALAMTDGDASRAETD